VPVDIFDVLVPTDTCLGRDREGPFGSAVNLFHRAAERIEGELDANEQAQRRSQREQDGSKIRSVELERLLAEGTTLIERGNAFRFVVGESARVFATHTGSAWRPRADSMVNRGILTAAAVDSRDFLAANRRAETEVIVPPGPKVAFTGGYECNDHQAIWAALDRVHAKYPDMVLLHGGSPKGAERIAACWADSRKVPQIAFRPDFMRHKNVASVQAQRQAAGGAADRCRGASRLGNSATRPNTRKTGVPQPDYHQNWGHIAFLLFRKLPRIPAETRWYVRRSRVSGRGREGVAVGCYESWPRRRLG
jgi:hypothetical protein